MPPENKAIKQRRGNQRIRAEGEWREAEKKNRAAAERSRPSVELNM
jgi:hypothetical protein